LWNLIIERLPKGATLFCTVLIVAVPWSIYKINQWLHQKGDPPWKKESS
jgi:hypothetical protein